MRIAIIDENIITDVKDIEESQYTSFSAIHQAVIDITDILPEPQVGWILEGSRLISNGNDVWLVTKLALRQRFTTSELLAIYAAKGSQPLLQILLDNVSVATFIDLKRPDTIAGIGMLYSFGLITEERRNIILNTPPTPTEAYRGQLQ